MKFDMKGSKYRRYVPIPRTENNFWRTTFNQSRVMKDLNYEEINQNMDLSFIRLTRKQFYELDIIQMKDSAFLERHGLMDYSLLLVIEHVKEVMDPTFVAQRSSGGKFDDFRSTINENFDEDEVDDKRLPSGG